MKSLDRKLLRDLWRIKGQALAIILVIASGVCAFVMLKGAMDSLDMTRDKFYRDFRFADVFVPVKRAPEEAALRIGELPGVKTVQTRVVAEAKLVIEGFGEPVTARIVSVPDTGSPALNGVYIRRGRQVDPWRDNEAVLSEAFASAHGLSPGDSIGAVINGRRKTLTIVGVGLSPEFVMQMRPGALSPDFKRYAVIWMGRNALGNAYDMEGAFNDLTLAVNTGANVNDVITRVDLVLERYGGLGAYSREDQMSNRFLDAEFQALGTSSRVFPAVFILVAAFLLNVVLNRIIGMERDQIGTLKAFGYANSAIGLHYIKLVFLIVAVGLAGGIIAGARLAGGLARIYMEFYRFPHLVFDLDAYSTLAVVLITVGSAAVATLASVRRAVIIPPAEAMRPAPPAKYARSVVERIGVGRFMSQPARMIIRNIERRPGKSVLTVTGIMLSCAIVIGSTFFQDAIDFMIDVQFTRSQKEDMTVVFTEPTSRKAVYELKGLEGVRHAEVMRTVPARLRFGHRTYLTSVQGIEPGGALYTLLDTDLKPVALPPEGVVLNDYLASMLKIAPGDRLTVEVLEGSRPVRNVPVAGLVKQYIGLSAFMDMTALNRMMREGGAVSGAYLTVDPLYRQALYEKLIDMPRVAGAVVRKDELKNFKETQAEMLLFYTFIASLLAGTIAFGVVYNSARISLSERSRELASLRVLGYTRSEISYILLGELALLTLAAIPAGFAVGWVLSVYLSGALSSELFRMTPVVAPATYSLSALVVVASAVLSGLIVRRKLDRLDLVEVLKTKE